MADALDVLTLAEAKAALNVAGVATHDAELPAWITAVSRRLDDAVGPIVARTVAAERHDGGAADVFCDLYPVRAVTTVTEYAGTTARVLVAETNATKPADAYLAPRYRPDPALLSGRLLRRASGADASFAAGTENVEVTYEAGRSVTTAAVDPLFKTAAAIMLAQLWSAQRPSVAVVGEFEVPTQHFPRFAIPRAVAELLAEHWQDGPRIAPAPR